MTLAPDREVRPDAVENLPSLDQFIGLDEAADTLATALAQLVLATRRIEEQRVTNQHAPDKPIAGFRPEPDGDYEATEGEEVIFGLPAKAGDKFRTYAQQQKIATAAFAEHMRNAKRQDIVAKVEVMTKAKIKETLERERQLRDAELAQQLKGADTPNEVENAGE